MSQLPNCPQCASVYTYEDRGLFVCPECGHEWSEADVAETGLVVKDANGNLLQEGDSVTIIKDLKVKGATVKTRHQSQKYPLSRRGSQHRL